MKKISTFILTILIMTNITAQNIQLPKPQTEGGMPLMEALKKRETKRDFIKDKEFSLQMLSNLLWAANGISRPESGKRTAPSAVNWQHVDIFVSLKQGVFLMNYEKNILELIKKGDFRSQIGQQDFVGDASAVLIYVSDRTKMLREGMSDETKVFYEATYSGNISLNVGLFATSENLKNVIIGSIIKENIIKILNLKEHQKPLLGHAVGY